MNKQANDKQQEKKEEIEQNDELVSEKEEELGEEYKGKKTQEQINTLKEEVKVYKSKYLRALADYQNLEKHSREERSEWIKNAGRNIILHMLTVLDTLILASKHSKDESLLVSISQFLDALKQEGVIRIDTQNKDFDPVSMECIQTVDGKEGKVVDEIRAGFTLHDKLLRPAEVIVGKKK